MVEDARLLEQNKTKAKNVYPQCIVSCPVKTTQYVDPNLLILKGQALVEEE